MILLKKGCDHTDLKLPDYKALMDIIFAASLDIHQLRSPSQLDEVITIEKDQKLEML
jgi:hypothetical protein